MRKALVILMAALMILSLAGSALADSIKSSKHDLSSTGHAEVATTESQVCVFCHTPHNARTIGPLWNRGDTGQTYTVYASESLDATVGQPVPGTPPRNVADTASGSDLCLSCHDGTIAVTSVEKNAFHSDGTRPAPTVPSPLPSPYALGADGKLLSTRTANLGTNLANDHPVAFDYDAARTAEATKYGATQLAATKVKGTEKFVDGSLQGTLGAGTDLPLFGGKMECDSCHNVHDPGASHAGGTFYPFLRGNMDASKLCLTCHVK